MEKFIKIVDKYDYPCKGFDFIENTEITFTNYIENLEKLYLLD